MTKDSLIVITPHQLKQTNLIFSEHSFLIKENFILNSQIDYLYKVNSNLTKLDSINNYNLIKVKELNEDYYSQIDKLQNKVCRKSNTLKWTIGSFSVATGCLLLYILLR